MGRHEQGGLVVKPLAPLSLDLDNLWAYQMIAGDPSWQDRGSYIEQFVPLALDLLAARDLKITFFVVGVDARDPRHREALTAIAAAGHEIGNHSDRHEPWLHRYDPAELATELDRSHHSIGEATGTAPIGFRGPGYSITDDAVALLLKLGYQYDASVLPTYLGPLARRFYFRSTGLDRKQQEERSALFGTWRDGRAPIRPHLWPAEGEALVEVPVTTLPVAKVPFHPSYLLYIAARSPRLSETYLASALWMCKLARIGPSLLLHPLDLMGGDEVPGLSFFPAMQTPGALKRERIGRYLDQLQARYELTSLGTYARLARSRLAERAAGEPAARPR